MKSKKIHVFSKMKNIKKLSDLPKKSIRLIAGIIVLTFIAHALFAPKGIINLISIYKQCENIESEISAEKAKMDSLNTVKQRLTTDKSYIERSARELIGVSSTDETVIKFVDPRE